MGLKVRGIAHRGYPKRLPENTLSSFQAALDGSFTHLELDVHLSKDDIPVVMHDEKLNRMCNEAGSIQDFTLKELKRFRIKKNESIPTLEESLRLVKDQITVMIELKQKGNLYPNLEKKVLEVIESLGMVNQVVISSFDHYSLVRMHKLNKDIQISLLVAGRTPFVFPHMEEINARYLSVGLPFITDDFVQVCSDYGVQLIARPVDDEKSRIQMLRWPAVLASTNELEEWSQFYKQHLDHFMKMA